MAIKATILYEDKLSANKQFGLHKFLLRCACDAHQVEDSDVYLVDCCIECRPLNGSGNLLRFLRNDVQKMAYDGRHVIAIFDNDKVRQLVQVLHTASDAEVVDTIMDGQHSEHVSVFLLKQNAESILRAAKDCGGIFDEDTYDRAVAHKEHPARDILFHNIAAKAHRAIRDCILTRIPCLPNIVGTLTNLLPRILNLSAIPH